jgi:hypothetical protein
MGGAGSWSIGAHYPDLWAAVQPGAGFAETYHFYDDESRPQDGPSGEFGEPTLEPPEGPIHGSVHVRDLPSYEVALCKFLLGTAISNVVGGRTDTSVCQGERATRLLTFAIYSTSRLLRTVAKTIASSRRHA